MEGGTVVRLALPPQQSPYSAGAGPWPECTEIPETCLESSWDHVRVAQKTNVFCAITDTASTAGPPDGTRRGVCGRRMAAAAVATNSR